MENIRPTLRLKSPYMRDGDELGSNVSQCQALLVSHGMTQTNGKPLDIDGIFGKQTEAAVRAFQALKKLTVDGICGSRTWAALEAPPAPKEEETPGEDWAQKLCQYVRSQVGNAYVWGGQGEDLSAMKDPEAWIRRRETSEKNALRAIVFFREAQSQGKDPVLAYDCSGLIVRFLMNSGLVSSDMSSRGLYNACAPISRSDLTPGDLVFRHDGSKIFHVGVYMGEGLAGEAKGRDDGVVIRPMDASGRGYWNRYGSLPLLH